MALIVLSATIHACSAGSGGAGTGGAVGTGGSGTGGAATGGAGTGGAGTGGVGTGGAGTGGAGTGGAGLGGVGGACTPAVVTDAVGPFGNFFNGFATDGTSVFWTDYMLDGSNTQVGRVMRVPVDGGVAVPIATTVGCALFSGLAVDGANVYFTVQASSIWKLPKNAPADPTTASAVFANGTCTLFGGTSLAATFGAYAIQGALTSDGTNVYAFGSSTTSLQKVPVDGSPASVLSTDGSLSENAVAADGTNVYYWRGGDLLSLSTLVPGAAPATLVANMSPSLSVSLIPSGGFLYWGDYTNSILRASTSGGGAVTVATGVSQRNFIAVDSANVYWVSASGPNNAVTRVALGGGTPMSLAPTPTGCGGSNRNCSQIIVDGTNVYWLDIPFVFSCPKSSAPRGGGL